MSTTTHSVDAIVQEITIKAPAARVAGRSGAADEVVGPKGPLRNYEYGIRSTARWPLADERHGLGTRTRPRRWCGLILMNRTASPRCA